MLEAGPSCHPVAVEHGDEDMDTPSRPPGQEGQAKGQVACELLGCVAPAPSAALSELSCVQDTGEGMGWGCGHSQSPSQQQHSLHWWHQEQRPWGHVPPEQCLSAVGQAGNDAAVQLDAVKGHPSSRLVTPQQEVQGHHEQQQAEHPVVQNSAVGKERRPSSVLEALGAAGSAAAGMWLKVFSFPVVEGTVKEELGGLPCPF